jgi:hypothetical protein
VAFPIKVSIPVDDLVRAFVSTSTGIGFSRLYAPKFAACYRYHGIKNPSEGCTCVLAISLSTDNVAPDFADPITSEFHVYSASK